MAKELLKTWKYKAGYHIRYYEVSEDEAGEEGLTFVMRSAFTPKGDYIGSAKMARFLIVDKGIVPEMANPEDTICTMPDHGPVRRERSSLL